MGYSAASVSSQGFDYYGFDYHGDTGGVLLKCRYTDNMNSMTPKQKLLRQLER